MIPPLGAPVVWADPRAPVSRPEDGVAGGRRVPRSRSRSRAGSPAARAARTVNGDAREVTRVRQVSTPMKIGQLLVFLAALGLLGLYTVSDQLARDEGFDVRIDWVSLALLGVAAFVVVLPRITRVHVAADGVAIDLAARAHDAALTAATVALDRGVADHDSRALLAGEPSPALTRAAVDPATSIELSRRALASELRRLAAVAGVPASPRSLVEYADRLYGARWLSGPEAAAIGQVAAVIDAARASGAVSTAIAQDVDDAVQLLVPVIDERLGHVAGQFERRTPRPAPPYDDLDDFDSTDHLDALDEVEEPEPAVAAALEVPEEDGVEIDLRDGAPDVAVTGNRADGPASSNATGTDAGAEPRALTPPAPEPVAWRSST
jgi:hypothetical protein